MLILKGDKYYNFHHPFHVVNPSPWPFTTATGAFTMAIGGVLYMHGFLGSFIFLVGLATLLISAILWWKDVVIEAILEGNHTLRVQKGLKIAVILFIASEIMFFFAFFWAFFHSSLAPTVEVGSVWPPLGIIKFCPVHLPLLNTVILLSSGAAVTWSHYAVLTGDKKESIIGLYCTVILGCLFTALQAYEYVYAVFTISDSVFGSIFYMATGFHGFHVLIGTIFLVVCLVRMIKDHFSSHHHVGFEAAIWYWHFVDVVWLFLFIVVYCWGFI